MIKRFNQLMGIGTLILLVSLAPIHAQEVDKTKIGVQVGMRFTGHVTHFFLNESGVTGALGQNLNQIDLGDETESREIIQLNVETGDYKVHHSLVHERTANWDAEYNLINFCGSMVYTDWDYWRSTHEDLLGSPVLQIFIVENEDYYGYISVGYGSQTDVSGTSTTTGHRQDCIYDKTTGFIEFFGLYQEVYYSSGTEVIHTVEQYLEDGSGDNLTPEVYLELVSDINSPISGNLSSIIPESSSNLGNSDESATLPLNFPYEGLLTLFMIPLYFSHKRNKKQ